MIMLATYGMMVMQVKLVMMFKGSHLPLRKVLVLV